MQCPSCGSEKVGVAKMEQGYQITCRCGYAGNVPALPRELKKAAVALEEPEQIVLADDGVDENEPEQDVVDSDSDNETDTELESEE